VGSGHAITSHRRTSASALSTHFFINRSGATENSSGIPGEPWRTPTPTRVPAASAADVVLPFTNYKVGATLTVKKLNQSITLPPRSTFNGSANLTTT